MIDTTTLASKVLMMLTEEKGMPQAVHTSQVRQAVTDVAHRHLIHIGDPVVEEAQDRVIIALGYLGYEKVTPLCSTLQ